MTGPIGGEPMRDVPIIPMGDDPGGGEAPGEPRPRPWQTLGGLSSTGSRGAWSGRGLDAAEGFLAAAGFDRAPWLAVVFAGGILVWFALPTPTHWMVAMAGGAGAALAALALWPPGSVADETRGNLRRAVVACGLVFALGLAVVWARSAIVGAAPIARPAVMLIEGRVLAREDQPAEGRLRLTLAMREAPDTAARKVRINVPLAALGEGGPPPGLAEGAVVRLRARLMPPAHPMLPGSYDFARAAWFQGLSATGTMVGPLAVITPAPGSGGIAALQRGLADHVRRQVTGSPGAIAAAFASGDRGGIAGVDEAAMRDSGLTHLLSISGLHVSAVIGAAYFLALRLLALWPALALRVRLPVVAAGAGALAGVGYTLLTGAEVPTVRSCVAALLVLGALALGRDALSLRMVALAAGFVLLLWPESAIGPSFQMSFAAVLAIVALAGSAPVQTFLAPREEPWWARGGRRVAMLFATGVVIELALMPIVLFHFHRAGIYGALANVVAIPLVTFIAMPLIALGLLLDTLGLGAPVWWLVARALELLLAIAHLTASQAGAVRLMPQIGGLTVALFAAGGLWLALWRGRVRLAGLLPVAAASAMAAATPIPDVLVAGDGRQVGLTVEDDEGNPRLLALRDSRSSYTRDNLMELAGVAAEPVPLAEWPGARCSSAFCTMSLERGGRESVLLLGRGREQIEERALAAACADADIVVAERFLPRSCRPRWLKADRRYLEHTGGLAIDLARERIATVAASQGEHGWWQGGKERVGKPRPEASAEAPPGQTAPHEATTGR
ncbi:ComEC/Rec2 family competence protein [Porphyrobacter sp. CACIAM 03H1]|uniref:ComEC/Rec2 family competence protein n=1 Tax=Porphyrobacter sp. CACIAM 03H1 TaxID=2003315 RepID=UPI001F378514|nr:ComEC/Rec2 family competence protein [Porphyrobacter sp. CACIAM 03H1]